MDGTALGILLALAFLPPLLFALWVRNHEKTNREPLRAVLGMFLYGGTLGVIIALALILVLDYSIGAEPGGLTLLSLVVIAPLIEELSKGLGLGLVRRRIDEIEDGIVYGAAIGLGFGATENLLYGLQALQDNGLEQAALTIGFRVLSSVLLHAGSTALLGYGYALMRLRNRGLVVVLPYYFLAVLQHALYNFLVGGQLLWSFVLAIVLVIVVTSLLRRQIKRLDAQPRDAWVAVNR
ncbi:MAG TPA: PrsW family intramembrane metalloprotease [Candidatus Thermoplasmatota archaeon]|nr:PrsW family intramembrane metalloprotease [Candidatus Thermoplasmatota archaeon]